VASHINWPIGAGCVCSSHHPARNYGAGAIASWQGKDDGIPLSRQAVEVLRALKLLTGNGKFVFPGANDKKKPMSNNTILYALYRLGYRDRMTGHGFRGLAWTILHENGFDEAHIELQLAHMKRNKVAAAYNHAKYLKQRTAMMQWWADYLDAQLM
jgi:integrase